MESLIFFQSRCGARKQHPPLLVATHSFPCAAASIKNAADGLTIGTKCKINSVLCVVADCGGGVWGVGRVYRGGVWGRCTGAGMGCGASVLGRVWGVGCGADVLGRVWGVGVGRVYQGGCGGDWRAGCGVWCVVCGVWGRCTGVGMVVVVCGGWGGCTGVVVLGWGPGHGAWGMMCGVLGHGVLGRGVLGRDVLGHGVLGHGVFGTWGIGRVYWGRCGGDVWGMGCGMWGECTGVGVVVVVCRM